MINSEHITLLAFWGAITGTIGTLAGVANLYIRHKQHQQDKALLDSESIFNFFSAPHHNHKIIVRSVGRRPVTLSSIRYLIRPKGVFKNLFRKKEHSAGRWMWMTFRR